MENLEILVMRVILKIYISNENGLIERNIKSFQDDSENEDMESVFIDIDNVNDLDLYVVSGGNEFVNRSVELSDRIYLNDGKGNFKRDIQEDIKNYTISGKTVISIDYDNDGDKDILLGGNLYDVKPEVGIYDASYGLYLENLGNLKFKYHRDGKGFVVKGEIRDILISNKNIFVSKNNDKMEVFKF